MSSSVTHEKTALTLQKTLTELDISELEKELEAVETEEENLLAEQEQQNAFFMFSTVSCTFLTFSMAFS